MKWLLVLVILVVIGCSTEISEEELKEISARIRQTEPITNSIGMKLKQIPAGTFLMGIGDDELMSFGVSSSPSSGHRVTLTKPFLLGVYEVTQEQYEKVMGTNPSHFEGKQHPIESVSWDDATEFCRKLSVLPEEKAAGRTYRLPTEAEWEYACRAGTTTAYSFGDHEFQLDNYAWYGNKGKKSSHPVGEKKPNPWGLFDMHGNVWEWCQDWYDYLPDGSVTDPEGPSSGSRRVYRGGGWHYPAGNCKSFYRRKWMPAEGLKFVGFRVAVNANSETP
ncbi:MAG: formylglycine-generating enzyme family protein [Rubripirellula sp.]